MNATQENIREYQKMLPRVKSKVMSAALLFVIAAVAMTSATFAWITLSVAPEVTGIETTISGNGNLEIALSPTDGLEPAESTAVDGSLSLVEKNVTWGNLVNLTDSSYGLQDIVLRPAALQSTLTSPLLAVEYTADGRLDSATTNFFYANYVGDDDDYEADFYIPAGTGVTIDYGVRPITSAVMAFGGDEVYISAQQTQATTYLASAQSKVSSTLVSDTEGLDAVATLLGDYMTARLSGKTSSSVTVSNSTLTSINVLLEAMDGVLAATGVAVQEMIYFEQMSADFGTYYGNKTSIDVLMTYDANAQAAADITTSSLSDYQEIMATWDDLAEIREFVATTASSNGKTTYDVIEDLVNTLADVDTALVAIGADASGGSSVTSLITKLEEGGATTMMSYYQKDLTVTIQSGLLNDIDKMLGVQVKVTGLSTKLSYSGYSSTNGVTIKTGISSPYTISTDITNAAPAYDGVATADETYAMALDFWVRTNATDTYLVLEGEPIYETIYYDINDKVVESDSEDVSYFETVVVGYQGVNRVWEGNSYLQDGSTTQGSGSSFVIDVDSDNRDQILKLLTGIKIGFFDGNGNQLGIAKMDVDNVYESGSRLTVPIVMDSGGEYVTLEGEDGTEETVTAITALEQNEATMITAIVYLDGNTVGNDSAISTLDLQGTLSLQFGSTEVLVAQEDEDLLNEYLTATASITDEDEFEYEDASEDGTWTTTVQVVTSGTADPTKITGNFDRMISSTQGTKQDTFEFTQSTTNSDIWEAEVTFSTPGTYTLSYIQVDDVNMDLQESATVTISGIAVESVSWVSVANESKMEDEIYTADSQYSRAINVTLGTSDDVTSVVASLYHDESGNRKTVTLSKQGDGSWQGTVAFTDTGTYTLDRITINGTMTDELATSLQKKLTVYLGLYVRTTADNQLFEATSEGTTVNVTAQIYDSTGTLVESLKALDSGATMTYSHNSMASYNATATMTWDAEEERYTGSFVITADGIYSFSSLAIDGHTIQKADIAPTVTAYSTTPPAYNMDTTSGTIIAPDNDAAFTLYFSDAAAATITATITGEGITRSVTGTTTGNSVEDMVNGGLLTEYSFLIPDNAGGSQDGTWQVTSFNMISGEHSVTQNVTSENIITTVVTEIEVSISLSETTANSLVMATTSVTPTVTVTDIYGEEIDLVTGIDVTYYYDQSDLASSASAVTTTSSAYYFDTSALSTNSAALETYTPTASILITDTDKDGDGKYTLSNLSFSGAGTYYPIVTVTTTGGSFTYADYDLYGNANMTTASGNKGTVWNATYIAMSNDATDDESDSFTLTWTSPDAKFTATSPSVGTSFSSDTDGDKSIDGETSTNAISSDGYYCDAYFGASATCGTVSSYNYSTATLTLQSATINLSNLSSAQVYFANTSSTYAASGYNTTYDYTTSYTDTENVGGKDGSSRRVLGESKIYSMTVVKDSITYTVPLANMLTLYGHS